MEFHDTNAEWLISSTKSSLAGKSITTRDKKDREEEESQAKWQKSASQKG